MLTSRCGSREAFCCLKTCCWRWKTGTATYRTPVKHLGKAPSVETHKGAPPKTVELAVAVYCARIFEALVGRPARISVGPTTNNEAGGPLNEAGGAFLVFLREVFGALGLEGSVEHYAKEAVQQLIREEK